jgi:hypothetical protein
MFTSFLPSYLYLGAPSPHFYIISALPPHFIISALAPHVSMSALLALIFSNPLSTLLSSPPLSTLDYPSSQIEIWKSNYAADELVGSTLDLPLPTASPLDASPRWLPLDTGSFFFGIDTPMHSNTQMHSCTQTLIHPKPPQMHPCAQSHTFLAPLVFSPSYTHPFTTRQHLYAYLQFPPCTLTGGQVRCTLYTIHSLYTIHHTLGGQVRCTLYRHSLYTIHHTLGGQVRCTLYRQRGGAAGRMGGEGEGVRERERQL